MVKRRKDSTYDSKSGRWTFKVDHFSASGISEPDEETIEWILRTCFKRRKEGNNEA